MDTVKIEVEQAENGWVVRTNGRTHVSTGLFDLGDICRRTVENAAEAAEAQGFEARVRELVAEFGADAVMEAAGRAE